MAQDASSPVTIAQQQRRLSVDEPPALEPPTYDRPETYIVTSDSLVILQCHARIQELESKFARHRGKIGVCSYASHISQRAVGRSDDTRQCYICAMEGEMTVADWNVRLQERDDIIEHHKDVIEQLRKHNAELEMTLRKIRGEAEATTVSSQ